MGYFNAKAGNNNTEYERVMGRNNCGIIIGNGEKFAEFCEKNNLVVSGTIFPHKDIHKLTWMKR